MSQCGGAWPHKQGPCPARGQICHKCGKPNHFAKVCFTQTGRREDQPKSRGCPSCSSHKSAVRQITHEQQSSSDDEYLYTLDQYPAVPKTPLMSVRVNSVLIKMIVDTGASTDIVDESAFTKSIRVGTFSCNTPQKEFLPMVPSRSSLYLANLMLQWSLQADAPHRPSGSYKVTMDPFSATKQRLIYLLLMSR